MSNFGRLSPSRRDLIAGAAAIGLLPASGTRAQQPAKVDVAVTGYDPLYAHTFIAHKAGLFRKHGVDANIINAQSGARIAQMIAAGQATYAMSGIIDAVRLTMAGKDAKLIAGFDARIPYANVLVHRDDRDKYRSMVDLAGQSVAVTQPQTPMWLMATYLAEKAGVKDKVTIRAAGDFVSMLAVVKTKQVAATIATVSMMDAAVNEGWGVPLFDVSNDAAWRAAFNGPVPGTACWTLARTTSARREETQSVVNALADAQALSLSQSASSIVDLIYDDYLRSLPREVAVRNVQAYKEGLWAKDNIIDEASYSRVSALMGGGRMYSDEEMSSKANYAAMVDMSFVRAVRKA